MLRPLFCVLALLPLAACGSGENGTSVTLNTSDADGNGVAVIGGNGQATIDMPFFKGKVTLPKLRLDAANFDMNGVHLYPGSTISGMNIAASGKPGRDGTVRVTFVSPAAPATVRDWFQTKLTAAGFTVAAKGDGLVGKTDEGDPFILDLSPERTSPDGTGKAKGMLAIG